MRRGNSCYAVGVLAMLSACGKTEGGSAAGTQMRDASLADARTTPDSPGDDGGVSSSTDGSADDAMRAVDGPVDAAAAAETSRASEADGAATCVQPELIEPWWDDRDPDICEPVFFDLEVGRNRDAGRICEALIGEFPPPLLPFDTRLAHIALHDNESGDEWALTKLADPTCCGDRPGGWLLDASRFPIRVTLCSVTCELLTDLWDVSLSYGCQAPP